MEDKKTDSQQSSVKTKNEKIAVLKQAAQDRLKVIKIMSIPLISIFAIQLAAGVILSQVKNKENPNPTFDANKEAELSIKNSESLTPDSLTDYKNNPEVTKLIFSKKTKNIKAEAFKDFKNIEEIIFREGCQLDSIGKDAFKGMTNLKKITFEDPNAITVFDLREYTKFESVQYGKDIEPSSKIETKDQYLARWNKEVLSANDLKDVKTISYNAFSFNANLKEVDLKSSKVSSIGQDAFQGTTLETIKFSNYFKEITNDSFKGMNTLKNVELGLNTTIIGNGSFEDTTALEHIDFLNTQLSKVGNNAFKNSGIKNFIAPDTLKEIGDNAFNGALNLENVELSTLTKLGSLAFANSQNIKKFDVHKFNKFLLSNFENLKIKHLVIGDSIKKLSKETIEGFELQKVSFKDVNELIDDLFLDNTTLQEVDFGDKMEIIGNNTFKNCHLTALTLPATLKRIGKAAFENVKLENLELPASLNFVGVSAFNNCNLKNVNFDLAKNAEFHAYSFANNDFYELRLTSILDLDKKLDVNTFKGCSKIKKVLLTDETVLPKGFYRNYVGDSRETFEDIFIPKSIVNKSFNPDNLALWFYEFADLTYRKVQAGWHGETKIEFVNNDSDVNLYQNLRNITYGKGCHTIMPIFSNLFLENINVKDEENIDLEFVGYKFIIDNINVKTDAITNFDQYGDYDYSNVNQYYINKLNNKFIGSSTNFSTPQLALDILTKITNKRNVYKTLVIPGNVENVPNNFMDRYSSAGMDACLAEELIFEEGIKTIGERSFNNLSMVKRIVFPNSLESIGAYSFDSLPNLEEIVWENNSKIKNISNIFSNLPKLKKIILPEGIISVNNSFRNLTSVEQIILPNSLNNILYSFNGLESIKKIEIKNIEASCDVSASFQLTDKMLENINNLQNVELNSSFDTIHFSLVDQNSNNFKLSKLFNKNLFLLSKRKKIIAKVDDYSTTNLSSLNERENNLKNLLDAKLDFKLYNDILDDYELHFEGYWKKILLNPYSKTAYSKITFAYDIELDLLDSSIFRSVKLKNIKLPRIKQLSLLTFQDCSNLETIEMSCSTSLLDSWTYNDNKPYAFYNTHKLTKIKLYDLNNLELEVINTTNSKIKYIKPTNEYLNRINTNASLEWNGSLFIFHLLNLHKFNKKIIFKEKAYLEKSFSTFYLDKMLFSEWDEIFTNKLLANELVFSDKINIINNSIFVDATFDNVEFKKDINKYLFTFDSSYRTNFGSCTIKKINGSTEFDIVYGFSKNSDNNTYYLNASFISCFTGKLKISSKINDISDHTSSTFYNFRFSELEIGNNVNKVPSFGFSKDFVRDSIKNITLSSTLTHSIYGLNVPFINGFVYVGIDKINNKTELSTKEFLENYQPNFNLLSAFKGKLILNSLTEKFNSNNNICLCSVLDIQETYTADNFPFSYYNFIFPNLTKITWNNLSSYLYFRSNTNTNKFPSLKNINNILVNQSELNLKDVLNSFGPNQGYEFGESFDKIDFSNTKLIIPEGYDFSKYSIKQNFKEIEIVGNVEVSKLPIMSFNTKNLIVDQSKLTTNQENNQFWEKFASSSYSSLNGKDEINSDNFGENKKALFSFTGKLIIASPQRYWLTDGTGTTNGWKCTSVVVQYTEQIIGPVFSKDYLKSLILPNSIRNISSNSFIDFKIENLEIAGTNIFDNGIANMFSLFNQLRNGSKVGSLNLLGSWVNKTILLSNSSDFDDFNNSREAEYFNAREKFIELIRKGVWNKIIFDNDVSEYKINDFMNNIISKEILQRYTYYGTPIFLPKRIDNYKNFIENNKNYINVYHKGLINYEYLEETENLVFDNMYSYYNLSPNFLSYKLFHVSKDITNHSSISFNSDDALDGFTFEFPSNNTSFLFLKDQIKYWASLDLSSSNERLKPRDEFIINFVYRNFSFQKDVISNIMQGIHEIFAEKEYGKYKSYFTKHFNDITIKFHNGYKFTISAKETGSNTGQYELYVKNCEFPPTQPASQNTLILTGTEEPWDLYNKCITHTGTKILFNNNPVSSQEKKFIWKLTEFYSDNTSVEEIEFGEDFYFSKSFFNNFFVEYFNLNKFKNLKKIILPKSAKYFDMSCLPLINYSEQNPLLIEIKSLNTYLNSSIEYTNYNNEYIEKWNNLYNAISAKTKIIYTNNIEFKFDKKEWDAYKYMYLKPINNASELNKNIYIEEMNNRLKYELTILGFLPSQGNFENVKLTRTNIFRNQLNDDETWHMYRQELNEWRSLSLLKIQR